MMKIVDALDTLTLPTARVERLRERAAERAHQSLTCQEAALWAARSWWHSAQESSHLVRRGRLAGDTLRHLTPAIDEDELLVGKYCLRALTADEQAELDRWQQYGAPAVDRAGGQTSHMAIDHTRVLREGVAGIRQQIAGYRARLELSRPADLEQDDFYRACLEALDGMVALAHQYAELAAAQANAATGPARQAELREIARVCRKVPEQPADTFAEAVQAVHFATFCMCAGNRMLLMQLGRPDRYLLPYYCRDRAAGRITPEQAQELIDCLGILLNEYTPRGLAVGWMVGGRDEYGADATNELSYLFVQAVGHIRLAYPSVGICWHAETPPALLTLGARLLARGYSHPALFNDDIITQGLRHLGLSHRDASLYIHSTCVEITPIGLSNVYVASPYYNLIQCLHDVLGIPPLGGDPTPLPEIPSFTDLLVRFRQRLRAAMTAGVQEINREMMSRAKNGGYPLLSCFVNDCLARGRDIDHGGARVNWLECSFVGLANLLDALAAIRILVYEEGTLTLPQLREALLANFAGHEALRARLASLPKYGNDDDRVDALAADITGFLREECAAQRSYWGDAVVPGFFCWIMHDILGRQACASADGRVAGFPFADGSGAAQGREHHGPTAHIASVTKWDHRPMIGGIAVNMRFQPSSAPETLVPPLAQVLETFLRLGGFEAQVNVVDTATLRAAQAHPERHRDLVVRVAGYSDYFVSLSPEMQAEVLARSENRL